MTDEEWARWLSTGWLSRNLNRDGFERDALEAMRHARVKELEQAIKAVCQYCELGLPMDPVHEMGHTRKDGTGGYVSCRSHALHQRLVELRTSPPPFRPEDVKV